MTVTSTNSDDDDDDRDEDDETHNDEIGDGGDGGCTSGCGIGVANVPSRGVALAIRVVYMSIHVIHVGLLFWDESTERCAWPIFWNGHKFVGCHFCAVFCVACLSAGFALRNLILKRDQCGSRRLATALASTSGKPLLARRCRTN